MSDYLEYNAKMPGGDIRTVEDYAVEAERLLGAAQNNITSRSGVGDVAMVGVGYALLALAKTVFNAGYTQVSSNQFFDALAVAISDSQNSPDTLANTARWLEIANRFIEEGVIRE